MNFIALINHSAAVSDAARKATSALQILPNPMTYFVITQMLKSDFFFNYN